MDDNGVFSSQGNTNDQSQPQSGVFVPSVGDAQTASSQAPLSNPSVYVTTQSQQLDTAPQPQMPLQGSFTPQPQMQSTAPTPPMNPQSNVASTTEDTPRFTLEDLYGPSAEAQNQPVPQNVPVTSQEQPMQAVSSTPSQSVETPQDSAEAHTLATEEVSSPQAPTPSATLSTEDHVSAPAEVSKSTEKNPVGGGNGGLPIPPILIKALGGLFLALIAIILITVISSLLRGNNSANKSVTLTYWGLWEDSNVFQGIIDDFHRQNPNITINYVKQDPEKYTDRLLTRIQNGTGPDIFRLHNTWVAPLQNALLPLPSSVLDPNQLKQNYFPVMSTDLVRNGAVYGVPLEMDNLVLYTNKDIFDHAGVKVPTTWEDFVTVSKGLTVKDADGHIKTAGAAIGTYENVAHAPDIVSLLLLQNGANLQKLTGSQNAIDALTFYTSFAKNDDRVWDTTLDNSLLAFERGKVAMYFGYSYDYLAIKAAAPQLNVEIHPVPHLPGRDMSIASYWVEGVSSKSTHPKEAFLFLKYLTQKDVLAKLYTEESKTRQFGEIYPRSDLAGGLTSDPSLSVFVDQSAKAVSSFFAADTKFDGFNGGLNRYLGNAINSMLNDTSADSALATLAQGVAQIFNQYATPSQ